MNLNNEKCQLISVARQFTNGHHKAQRGQFCIEEVRDKSHGLSALSRVWQYVKLSDVSLGTRLRYRRVVDEDVKKSTKQTHKKAQKVHCLHFKCDQGMATAIQFVDFGFDPLIT